MIGVLLSPRNAQKLFYAMHVVLSQSYLPHFGSCFLMVQVIPALILSRLKYAHLPLKDGYVVFPCNERPILCLLHLEIKF